MTDSPVAERGDAAPRIDHPAWTQAPADKRMIGPRELTALLAMVMSVIALAVDIILPAFADIRADFGLAPDSTAAAGLITTFLLGMAISQLVFGLLADRFGRKPMLYLGFGLYIAGAVASMLAPSLGALLFARFVWGAGAASPRVLLLSVLRDIYSRERMARAMSFVMALFVTVPVVAPSIGAVLTTWINWRAAIGFCVVVAIGAVVWSLRLPETLRPENRLELNARDLTRAATFVFTNRVTVGYMLAFTSLFGGFASYLASSELIFSDVFGLADEFPVIFGAVAIVLGIAVLINGALVERVGLERIIRFAMAGYVIGATGLVWLSLSTGGTPGFWPFILVFSAMLSMHALLIPNMNTAAMVPMAPVAGTASAIIGTVSTAVGAVLGNVIDRAYDGTINPLSVSFLVLGVTAWVMVRWADRSAQRTLTPVPQPAD